MEQNICSSCLAVAGCQPPTFGKKNEKEIFNKRRGCDNRCNCCGGYCDNGMP